MLPTYLALLADYWGKCACFSEHNFSKRSSCLEIATVKSFRNSFAFCTSSLLGTAMAEKPADTRQSNPCRSHHDAHGIGAQLGKPWTMQLELSFIIYVG